MEIAEARARVLTEVRNFFKQSHEPEFIAGKTYIPAAKQVLAEDDLLTLTECVLDQQYASGPRTKMFESMLHTYFPRMAKPMMVNSGSSANLVAVSSLSSHTMDTRPLYPGDEVITVAAGFPTTVAPILQNGWVPVFVDVDYRTLNALPDAVKAAKTSKTRAVVLAHTLGNPYRADVLAQWCARENLFLVEDCCDALGSTLDHWYVGGFGHYATLSFYPAHHMSTGEGGAVVAKDNKLRKIAASFRDWGRDCWCEPARDNTCGKRFKWDMGELPYGYDHKYIYTHLGYNLKASELQASLGVSQAKQLPGFIEKRRENYKALYYGILSSPWLAPFLIPVEATEASNPSWFSFPMHCREGIDRKELTEYLEKHKVGTRLVFGGNLTKQPAFKGEDFRIHGELTNTDKIMADTFWIGVHPGIEAKHVTYMLEQLEAGVRDQL